MFPERPGGAAFLSAHLGPDSISSRGRLAMFRNSLCALCALLCLTSCLFGQEEKTPTKKGDGSIREQTIYIPYSKLKKVFEQQGRGVFVPYEKFQELWRQAQKNQPQPLCAASANGRLDHLD